MKSLPVLLTAAMAIAATSAWAAPVTYVIDPDHTFERFSYTHMDFSTQEQRFNHTSGKVVFDEAAKTGSVDIEVDITSVDTGSKLNEHIQNEDLFNTAKYPTATFHSTAVKFKDGKPSEIEGDLTIKGITKHLTLTVTSFHHGVNQMMHKEQIGANATAHLLRSEFGLTKFIPLVSDEVHLSVSMEARAE